MKKDTVKRRMPNYYYDTIAIQEYLREQASKGLFVKKIGYFITYEKGVPANQEYLLLAKKTSKESVEERMYDWCWERGWKYICEYRAEFYVLAKNNAGVFEKTITKEDREEAVNALEHRFKINIFKQLIYNLFTLLIEIILPISLQLSIVSLLMNNRILLVYSLILLMNMPLLLLAIKDFNFVRRHKKYLIEEKEKDFSNKKDQIFHRVVDLIQVALLVLFAILLLTHSIMKQDSYEGELLDSLPLTLSSIEDDQKDQWYVPKQEPNQLQASTDEATLDKGIIGNLITVKEKGIYLQQKSEAINFCDLDTYIYQIDFPWLKDNMMKLAIQDTMSKYKHYLNEEAEVTPVNYSGSDESYLYEEDDIQLLFLKKDDRIYAIAYRGRRSLKDWSNESGEIH